MTHPSFTNQLRHKRVVVVGAGLAGLTAAYRLKQSGFSVDIYEARKRPGGRVYTVSLGDSYAELGGQSLADGGDATSIRNLIHEMGLSIETAWQNHFYTLAVIFNDHLEDYSNFILDLPKADETLWSHLLSLSKQAHSMSDVLDNLFGKNSKLRLYFERLLRGYEGSNSDHLSVTYISTLFTFIKLSQERAYAQTQGKPSTLSLSHVKGGNGKLVDALAQELQGRIHYQSILKKMNRNSNGSIDLHFESKNTIVAECVILAIPCSTLRDVEIADGLFPPDQLEAIHTLQYGTNGKILMPICLSSCPPQPELLSTKRFFSWFNHDYSILVLYYGGSCGIFPSKNREDISIKILEELPLLRLAYPTAHFPKDVQAVGISWLHEEFSKGSYSNLGIQQEKTFQYNVKICGENVKYLFRPIRNQIYFAGEHTSIDYPATLEGAVESGEKAARLIEATST